MRGLQRNEDANHSAGSFWGYCWASLHLFPWRWFRLRSVGYDKHRLRPLHGYGNAFVIENGVVDPALAIGIVGRVLLQAPSLRIVRNEHETENDLQRFDGTVD